MPFNFLHHHAEDEHGMAMHRHEKKEAHHCELDDHFCQPDSLSDCQHEQHIAKTIAKCFGCEFHFIKHYTATHSVTTFFQDVVCGDYRKFQPQQLREALILLSNKGPPALT